MKETNLSDISEYFQHGPKLSASAKQIFFNALEFKNFGKGDTFIKINQESKYEYLVLQGIARSFITDPNGNEITLSFFRTNQALSPSLTRTKAQKSIINMQAITDMRIARFSNGDLMSMMESNQEIRNWGNWVLQNELMNKVYKEINQLSLPAKERLLSFRNTHPNLENLIPHGYIASYLGITPVSLSRLRKELSNK